MSAVGNYVHYHYSYYKRYGTKNPTTNRKIKEEQDVLEKAQRAFNAQKKIMTSKIKTAQGGQVDKAKLQEIQKLLSAILYPEKGEKRTAEVNRERFMEKLGKNFIDETEGLFVDWANGGVVRSAVFKPGATKFRRGTLDTLLKTMQNNAEQIKVQETKDNLNKAIAACSALIGELKKVNLGGGTDSSDFIQIDKMGGSLANQYNDFLNLLDQFDTAWLHSYQTGAFFENLIDYVLSPQNFEKIQDDQVEEQIKELTESFITAHGKSPYTTDRTNRIWSNTKIEVEDGKSKKTIFKNTETIKVGDDKFGIDATFRTGVNNIKADITYNNNLRISAKNVQLGGKEKKVIIQKEGSFLGELMKSIENDNTINHWLNVTASHTYGKSDKEKFQLDGSRVKATDVLADAHRLARSAIALQTLSGFSQVDGYANAVIINARTERKVKVYVISELLEKIMAAPLQGSIFTISHYPRNTYKYNKWVDGPLNAASAQQRIGGLLGGLRNLKISASLNMKNLESGKN